MRRRRYLLGAGSLVTTAVAGCLTSVRLGGRNDVPAADVFAGYRYDRSELVVEFREDVDVERALLYDSAASVEHETIERPAAEVRFPVVFPNRLETYVRSRPSLRVRAETSVGTARQSVWEPVHGVARGVTPLPDGRARFDLENQGAAPLLVRFVGIYGDVPNPTVDVGADDVDLPSFDPGVIGIGPNRPPTPTRTDLVVPGGESAPFETTYEPFGTPTAGTDSSDETVRTGTIGILHASGSTTAYDFSYAAGDD